jgi:hypothetical protein
LADGREEVFGGVGAGQAERPRFSFVEAVQTGSVRYIRRGRFEYGRLNFFRVEKNTHYPNFLEV